MKIVNLPELPQNEQNDGEVERCNDHHALSESHYDTWWIEMVKYLFICYNLDFFHLKQTYHRMYEDLVFI